MQHGERSTEMQIIKARKLSPKDGHLGMVAGPPGTGKSWFCGSIAEYCEPEEILVIATMPREAESYMYQKHDVDVCVVYDHRWIPDRGKFEATGYNELLKIFEDLRTDTKYKAIIIDNGTEMGELAWHDAMAPHGVSSPAKIKGNNKWDPYVQITENIQQLLTGMMILTGKIITPDGDELPTGVARPKFVWVPWHLQPPKEKPDGDESADEKAKGSEYMGEMLPMLKGGFRRKIAGFFSAVVYSGIVSVQTGEGMKMEPNYVVQVIGDHEKHAKIPGPMPDKKDLIRGKYIPNNFSEFMKLL